MSACPLRCVPQPHTLRLMGLSMLGAMLLSATSLSAAGPEPILLWPEGAPGAIGDEPADKPELRIYLPAKEKATGAGVVICPGGGYGILATDHEGHQIARWFNTIGVAGFVLKYRHAPRYRHPAPLADAQRAIRHVRANAGQLNVSPRRIGIMGFSAGGHLASTAATHFDSGKPESEDPVERVSSRPDYAILGYPVISMIEEYGHAGSRQRLLGDNFDSQLAEFLSNEKQVTKETPPCFLFHTGEDAAVPVENSLAFYRALTKAGVPAELHVYQYGPHGVGLAPGAPDLAGWKDRLADWMKTSGFLADVTRAEVSGTVTVNGQPLRWGQITFIPVDSNNKPAAFAMISQGKYQIPAARGVVVGENRVEIHDLGSVEPRPTVEEARKFETDLRATVGTGKSTFNFDIRD